jgi:hypothetical protein
MLLRRTYSSRAGPSSLGRLGTETEGAHELVEAGIIGPALVTFFGAGWGLLGYTLWSGKGLQEASQD